MEQEGLIRTEAEERQGARLRKIYAITETGEAMFQQMLRQSLTIPPHSVKSDFSLGLSWIGLLPKEESLPLLEQNLRQLEETHQLWITGREIKNKYGLTPEAEASFDNAIGLLELDIQYVKRIIELVKKGETTSSYPFSYLVRALNRTLLPQHPLTEIGLPLLCLCEFTLLSLTVACSPFAGNEELNKKIEFTTLQYSLIRIKQL